MIWDLKKSLTPYVMSWFAHCKALIQTSESHKNLRALHTAAESINWRTKLEFLSFRGKIYETRFDIISPS
jgi:hypothetical protein